jgi:hypothetical protein
MSLTKLYYFNNTILVSYSTCFIHTSYLPLQLLLFTVNRSLALTGNYFYWALPSFYGSNLYETNAVTIYSLEYQ